MKALPIQDAAQDGFRTLPGHTNTREDDGQPMVEGVTRLPVPQTRFPTPAWGLGERVEQTGWTKTDEHTKERGFMAQQAHIGTSGLTLFYKVEHSFLLSLVGKTSRAIQYTIGNPLLAIQMTRYMPEAALYAPLRLVVYEDE